MPARPVPLEFVCVTCRFAGPRASHVPMRHCTAPWSHGVGTQPHGYVPLVNERGRAWGCEGWERATARPPAGDA
jgi:hypothetical protein